MTEKPVTAERERLRQLDDGPADELVYVSISHWTGKRAYHVSPDCMYLDDAETKTLERSTAKARDHWPCRCCVLELLSAHGSPRHAICPLCGEQLDGHGLSTHLPECDGPAAGSALPSQGVAD